MTTDRTADRCRFTLASLAAGALAAVLRPLRALAQAVEPMVEHPFARLNYLPGAPQRAKVGSGKIIRGQVVSAGSGRPIANASPSYSPG